MKSPIWKSFDVKNKGKKENIFKILSTVPIFSDLNRKELTEVEKIIHRRKYKKNEPIFRMGDPGLGMYIIIDGTVEIIEESEEGDNRHVASLEAGAFFGDLALLNEAPRSASAIARTDCDIIGFFRPDLLDLLYRKPNIGIKILWGLAQTIGERLRQTNDQLNKLQRTAENSING